MRLDVSIPRSPASDEWMRRGACRSSDVKTIVELDAALFADADEPSPIITKLCGGCPVKLECEQRGLAQREPYGVWGGLTPFQRRQVLSRRSRVHCPSCGSADVHIIEYVTPPIEACVACGLTWYA